MTHLVLSRISGKLFCFVLTTLIEIDVPHRAMCHNPDEYPDPDAFKPERFIDTDEYRWPRDACMLPHPPILCSAKLMIIIHKLKLLHSQLVHAAASALDFPSQRACASLRRSSSGTRFFYLRTYSLYLWRSRSARYFL